MTKPVKIKNSLSASSILSILLTFCISSLSYGRSLCNTSTNSAKGPLILLFKKRKLDIMKYSAGDEILRCEPFAHVVLPGFDICDWCLKKSEELMKCKSCALAKYCSSECIDIAWKEGHREECKLMKKSATRRHFHRSHLFLLRRLVMLSQSPLTSPK